MKFEPIKPEDLQWGECGERMVARWLIERGSMIMPLYQGSYDRAPMIEALDNDIVTPDLFVMSRGKAFYAECKRKRRWVRPSPSNGGTLETGCNLRNFRHYAELRKRSGIPVWMFFIHQNTEPTGLFCGSVSALDAAIREWDGRHYDSRDRVSVPMALFPIWSLRKVADLQDIKALDQEDEGLQLRLFARRAS